MTQDPTAGPAQSPAVARATRGRRLRGLLLSAVIFISGGACGWGIACLPLFHRHSMAGFRPDPPVDQIVHEMKDELMLSDQQAKDIEQVYQKRFAALQAIRAGMLPKFKTEYDGLRSDVQKILTAPQFERWSVRFDAVRNQMMPPPPHSPHGGPHGPMDRPEGPMGGPPGDGPMGPMGGHPPMDEPPPQR